MSGIGFTTCEARGSLYLYCQFKWKGLLCGLSLTQPEQAKSRYGTSRTFILEDCYRRNICKSRRTNAASQFLFAYKNEPETLHIRESKIPANRIKRLLEILELENRLSPVLCGLEKAVRRSYMEWKSLPSKDGLNTCCCSMQEVNHRLFYETVDVKDVDGRTRTEAKKILAELGDEFQDGRPMSLSAIRNSG